MHRLLRLVEPAVLHGERSDTVVAADAHHRALGDGELRRPAARHRHGKREPDARIVLLVVLGRAVDRRSSADVAPEVSGEPQAGTEVVAEMQLVDGKRFLAFAVAAEEIVVVAEEPDAGGCFGEPLAERHREPGVRLERPAVGADVDELLAVVLAGGRDHIDAHTAGERLAPLRELARRKGGMAEQVQRAAQAQVADARAVYGAGLLHDRAGDVGLHVRHDDGEVRRAAEELGEARVAERVDVHLRIDVDGDERRTGQHRAAETRVAKDGEVGAGRRAGVGAWLELLRGGKSRDERRRQERRAHQGSDAFRIGAQTPSLGSGSTSPARTLTRWPTRKRAGSRGRKMRRSPSSMLTTTSWVLWANWACISAVPAAPK